MRGWADEAAPGAGPPRLRILTVASHGEMGRLRLADLLDGGFDVVLASTDQIDSSDLVTATVLILGSTVGFFLSGPVRHVVDRRGISQLVYAVAALGAISLLIRSTT